MATSTLSISTNVYLLTILSSAVVAALVTVGLTWLKEYFQNETRRYEKLYGEVSYNLLAMKVLKINRMELLGELRNEPVPENAESIIKKYSVVNPLIIKWDDHRDKLKKAFENKAGYIKKKHLKLVEDFLDGYIKREITEGGKSIRTTNERINKIFDAIEALESAFL